MLGPVDDWSFLTAVDEMMHPAGTLRRTARNARLRRLVDTIWPDGHPTRLVHVVGTNGKGTTAACLEQGFLAAGFRAGAIISPHVFDIRERWRVGGEPVEAATFARVWRDVVRPAVAAAEADFGFFDLVVLSGLAVLAETKCEWASVEAGIGGRYDRLTAFDRAAVVLTNVGDDHADQLGDTLWQRQLDKAGAAIAGHPVITGQDLPATLWSGLEPPPKVHVVPPPSAPGDIDHHRLHAIALTLATLTACDLPVAAPAVSARCADLQLPGRWDWIDPLCVLDIAHDADAVASFVRRITVAADIDPRWHDGPWAAAVGLSRSRSATEVLGPLLDRCDRFFVASAPPFGRQPSEIAAELRSAGVNAERIVECADPQAAVAAARDTGVPVVVTGSAHFVGASRPVDPRLAHLDRTFGWRNRA